MNPDVLEAQLLKAGLEIPNERSVGSFLPEPVDASSLTLESLPPDPPFIVDGLFHQGSKLVLAGSSKVGKTWSLIDLAVSAATGNSWWGFPTNQCPVLYVNFEIQPPFFHRRVARIKRERRLEVAPGALQIIHLRGTTIAAELFGMEMQERYRDAGLGLIILDPLYKLMVGREENSTATVSGVADVIDGIATACGAAVAYGAHFSKGNQSGKEVIDRINGSGVTGRDADSILTLTKHDEANCYTLDAVLRNCPSIEPKVMRWNFPLMEEASELDPANLKKAGGRPEKIMAFTILKFFGCQNSLSRKEVLSLCSPYDVSEKTVDRKLAELVEKGKLTTTKGTGLYMLA